MRHLNSTLLVLAACGGSSRTTSEPATSSSPTEPTAPAVAANCSTSAPRLLTSDTVIGGGAKHTIEILESGSWTYQLDGVVKKTDCLTPAEISELVALARRAQTKILSSNQSCPKPSSQTFTLAIAGKPSLQWDDGGCGTELDPGTTALLAKLPSPPPVATTPPTQTPPANDPPPMGGPPTSRPKTTGTLGEIDAVIKLDGCSDVAQCTLLPLGKRACGGPALYRVYCSKTTDKKKLDPLVKKLNKESANRAKGTVGICVVAEPPTISIANDTCVATGGDM